MNSAKALLKNLMSDESGQDLIEYGLIAALIALACVTLMSSVGKSIGNVFTNINNDL